jgi:NAD dependent epimerase/dehydratase
MNWNNRKVLITGAGGFIGTHLTEKLVSEGASVRAFVRYNSRGDPGLLRQLPASTLAQIEIFPGDLRDAQMVEQAVAGCQTVFHLGAIISIPYSYHDPYAVAETNFLGTMNMLMACKKGNVERLVHTSTSEVYGTAQQVPINETHPLQGQSPYSASKIGADKLAESFYCAYELPVVTVRPFNTFGPRQSARAVIPVIITQALASQKIRLGNLDTTRDFTYVSDTVAGFMKAAEAEGVEGKTFNLGTGQEIRIGDLAQMIIQKVNPAIELDIDPQRLRPGKSEVFRLISDNSLARSSIGWRPEVSFEQGIDLTIDWIKDHLNLYRVGTYEF